MEISSLVGREGGGYDVVVVGAGNAGLCAAIAARQQGAGVLVLEKAPPEEQGGNCSYTGGGLRFVHRGSCDIAPLLSATGQEPPAELQPYPAEEYRYDLLRASQGEVDPDLSDLVLERSYDTIRWLTSLGVVWEQRYHSPSNAFAQLLRPITIGAVDGGGGLLRVLTAAATRAGVHIAYRTKLLRLHLGASNRVSAVTVAGERRLYEVEARSVVLACGGFETNQEMRVRYLGPTWEHARVRGSKYNTGDGLRAALELGAATNGQLTGCHAMPVDASAPPAGTPESAARVPRRSFHLGIMVNVEGKRFIDEGQGINDLCFRQAAAAILRQPQRLALQIFDAKAAPHLAPQYASSRPISADSLGQLAQRMDVPRDALEETVRQFNACANAVELDPLAPDGNFTRGLSPSKSNWALPLDTPPFVAYRVTGGITYSYGGLKVDRHARVLDTEGTPIEGLYAAGVIVGGFFHYESLRGSGLMLGAVLGRIAGHHAAMSPPER